MTTPAGSTPPHSSVSAETRDSISSSPHPPASTADPLSVTSGIPCRPALRADENDSPSDEASRSAGDDRARPDRTGIRTPQTPASARSSRVESDVAVVVVVDVGGQ